MADISQSTALEMVPDNEEPRLPLLSSGTYSYGFKISSENREMDDTILGRYRYITILPPRAHIIINFYKTALLHDGMVFFLSRVAGYDEPWRCDVYYDFKEVSPSGISIYRGHCCLGEVSNNVTDENIRDLLLAFAQKYRR